MVNCLSARNIPLYALCSFVYMYYYSCGQCEYERNPTIVRIKHNIEQFNMYVLVEYVNYMATLLYTQRCLFFVCLDDGDETFKIHIHLQRRVGIFYVSRKRDTKKMLEEQ